MSSSSSCAGGGRKIIRCEVSLDDGKTWRLGDIQRFEEPNEYGKHWCWVHWTLEVRRRSEEEWAPVGEMGDVGWDGGMGLCVPPAPRTHCFALPPPPKKHR